MWPAVRAALAGADPLRIENACDEGTPDVNCVHGWIELKHVHAYPKRGGAVALPHFRPSQRAWLLRRNAAGGRCWLLLRIDRDWYLLPGMWAACRLGKGADAEEIADAAETCWFGKAPDAATMLAAFRGPHPIPEKATR